MFRLCGMMWLGAVVVALICVSYSPHLSPVLKCTELQEVVLHNSVALSSFKKQT